MEMADIGRDQGWGAIGHQQPKLQEFAVKTSAFGRSKTKIRRTQSVRK